LRRRNDGLIPSSHDGDVAPSDLQFVAAIYGEEIHAAVVPRTDATAAELQAYCKSRFSAFEIPKVIHFVKELPESSTGKADRHRLSELFSS